MISAQGRTNLTVSIRLRNLDAYTDSRGDRVTSRSLSYRLDDGSQLAIVGPSVRKPGVDWKASTYGVSSKCAAVPRSACVQVYPDNSTVVDTGFITYNCSKNNGFMDVEVTMQNFAHQVHYWDNHALFDDGLFFQDEASRDYGPMDRAAKKHAANSTSSPLLHYTHTL